MWDAFVELLRAAIFGAAHVCGGSLGSGILFVSAAIRLALLPLTLRLAREAREQRSRLATLEPEIAALQRRFANDPRRLMAEMRALHERNGIKLATPSAFIGLAVQFPVFGALFSAVRTGLGSKVRFLWVADLSRADRTLALAVAALTAWGVSQTPSVPGQPTSQTTAVLVTVVATLVFLWSASSAVALSAGAGSLVSLLQNWLLSRDAAKANA